MPLAAFARIVGPRLTHRQVVVRGRPVMATATADPGDPDEVWLKVLASRHPNEKHTPSEWRGLIDRYRREPAHPAHPGYRG